MEYPFFFLDHPGSRHIRQHKIIADSRELATQMCRQYIGHRFPNFVLLPVDSRAEAEAFMQGVRV